MHVSVLTNEYACRHFNPLNMPAQEAYMHGLAQIHALGRMGGVRGGRGF